MIRIRRCTLINTGITFVIPFLFFGYTPIYFDNYSMNNSDESKEMDIDSKLFISEIQNAVYVGNHYAVEAVGNIVVSHDIISEKPRRESVKGYLSFMANDIFNMEMGNIGLISEFDLREPSKRKCHEILRVGDTILVGTTLLKIAFFIGDPIIFDFSPSSLYYVFRCGNNENYKGCTIGCFVDKRTFKVKTAHFITIDGETIANLKTPQDIWSNTRIVKYNNYYYRSYRDNVKGKIIIARSSNLIDWTTWLDISNSMSFVQGTSKNSFCETDIAIDESKSIMYFAVRSTSVILGKTFINEIPFIESMSYIPNINPTRPSMVFFNGNIYLICNTNEANDSNKILNGIKINRAFPALFKIGEDLKVKKKWTGFSCIGGNYQVLYSYGTQLLCGLNFNKQGLNNTASLERCGVYFTSLYSICNDN